MNGESATIDLSTANTQINALVEALKTFVTDNAGVIFGVAGAFVVFWVLRVALRIIKSFAKA